MGVAPEKVAKILPLVSQQVKEAAGFELDDLEILGYSLKCKVPVLFLHATGDDFVVPENSKLNFDSWGGKIKQYKTFDGDHES